MSRRHLVAQRRACMQRRTHSPSPRLGWPSLCLLPSSQQPSFACRHTLSGAFCIMMWSAFAVCHTMRVRCLDLTARQDCARAPQSACNLLAVCGTEDQRFSLMALARVTQSAGPFVW
eukprot:3802067-Rhodomonas_salina.5